MQNSNIEQAHIKEINISMDIGKNKLRITIEPITPITINADKIRSFIHTPPKRLFLWLYSIIALSNSFSLKSGHSVSVE